MPKTVLFVTYHFPPSAASGTHRLLGFAEHLPTLGWQVAVVSPSIIPWEAVDERLVSRIPAATNVSYVDYPTGRMYWPLRKIHGFAAWLPRVLRRMGRLMATISPDVVVTSGPPHCVHLVGLYLKRSSGVTWLADFRDPWVAGNFTVQTDWWWNSSARVGERWVFDRADAIIANAPNAQKIVATHYPQHADKIHCVTNGYDPTQFVGLVHSPSKRFVVTHAGELYAGRDPRPFLDAVRLTLDENQGERDRLIIDFVGSASSGEFDLNAEIEKRGLAGTVHSIGTVPYRQSLERMARSDLLLLIDSPSRTVGVPAKLYEYIGAKRPILALASAESDVDWVLRQASRPYQLVGTQDVHGIHIALRRFLKGPSLTAVSGDCSTFTRNSTARKLSQIMEALVPPERDIVATQVQTEIPSALTGDFRC